MHKKISTKFLLLFSCLSLLFACAGARAQSERTTSAPKEPPVRSNSSTLQVELPTPVAETPVPLIGSAHQMQTLSFITPDANFERTVVKGAAFSADTLTEHVQTLADGNRMGRKSVAHIYRDGSGRTRREHELTRIGILGSNGQPSRVIVINDPIGQVNYVIETHTGVARKQQLPPAQVMEAMRRVRGDNAPFSVLMPTSAAHRRAAEGDAAPPPSKPVREKLLPQVIEGVMAEGTRTTLTIPAGEFDNEQPMVITHEEWYAPELQMIVLMKHNDPRFGQTMFQLTNIIRGEPSPELFQLPPGFRVVEAGGRLDRRGPRADLPAPGRP